MITEMIREKIGEGVFGRELYYFESVDSTNLAAKKFALDGAAEGSVVLAREQTSGTGRQGREWISEPGKDLACSLILRPAIDPARIGVLSLFASTGVAAALGAMTGMECRCKWPNDVLLGGKKVSGILSESILGGREVRAVVIGIGVNVNRDTFPPPIGDAATSLLLATGRPWEPGDVLARILRELESRYMFPASGRQDEACDAILNEWSERSAVLGREIVVEQGERQLRGRAVSVDADGSLVLETPQGVHHLAAGDVHIV